MLLVAAAGVPDHDAGLDVQPQHDWGIHERPTHAAGELTDRQASTA